MVSHTSFSRDGYLPQLPAQILPGADRGRDLRQSLSERASLDMLRQKVPNPSSGSSRVPIRAGLKRQRPLERAALDLLKQPGPVPASGSAGVLIREGLKRQSLPERAALDLLKKLIGLKGLQVDAPPAQVLQQPLHLVRAALPLKAVLGPVVLAQGVLLRSASFLHITQPVIPMTEHDAISLVLQEFDDISASCGNLLAACMIACSLQITSVWRCGYEGPLPRMHTARSS